MLCLPRLVNGVELNQGLKFHPEFRDRVEVYRLHLEPRKLNLAFDNNGDPTGQLQSCDNLTPLSRKVLNFSSVPFKQEGCRSQFQD
jgi:hypothetical protein